MKKLMILAAVVAMGSSVAFGSTAKWKISNISTYNTKGETAVKVTADAANYQLYMLYSADATLNADFTNGKFTYTGDTLISSGNILGSGGTSAAGKNIETPDQSGYWYYVALFQSDTGKTVGADSFDYYTISGAIEGNPYGHDATPATGLVWTPGETYAYSQWQSVPEPTSGLLLLLGVAGLALRRRRA